jgi:iron complex outermembrane receptor protein
VSKQNLFLGAAFCALCFAAPAWAAEDAATAAADTAAVQEIVVVGHGETRQVQTLNQADIAIAPPGSSPLKAISRLPGVNYQASDAFGAYEWAVRISVRGFNQSQMGFTVDGVPLGDMNYGNYNGLHISRAISSENIGDTRLAAGTASLGTASSSNLGGALEFLSRAPSDTLGGLVTGTYGSYDTNREFVRVDSGEVAGGGKGYLSFDNQFSNKWKGDGVQKQIQVNSKWVQPVGPVTLTGWLDYSDRRENDYQDLTLGWVKQFGLGLDNISNNWPLAVALAHAYQNGTAYPAPFTNTPDAIDAVYFNGSGLRKDTIGALKGDWAITEGLAAHLTGYGHHNIGEGTWDTPYTPSPPGGAPISMRTTEYDIRRAGAIGSLEYKIAGHDVEGGFWYENNDFTNARRYYALDANGDNRSNLEFQTDPFRTDWVGDFNTKTTEFHLQDTWRVIDSVKLNFGFKALNVDVKASQPVGTLAAGEIKSDDGFLPQAGVNWGIDGSNELFADYAKNMRAFVGTNSPGANSPAPFATTQAGFNAIKGSLKPETSQTGEVGYRFRAGTFQAVATAYYVKFDNRLLGVTVGSGIQGNPIVLENVGSVTSKGGELTGVWRFIQDWSLSGSYSYDASTYDNNVRNGDGSVVLTAGKTVVDSPNNIANATLGYDNGSWFANATANYMSQRFFTYTNDQSVPGRTTLDLAFGYRFHADNPVLKGMEIQGNVANATNARYIGSIGTNGFGNSGDNQTLQAAAPLEAFVTLRKSF